MSTSTAQGEIGFSEQLEGGRGTKNYNRWIAEQFLPYTGNRVLEVGCGIGNLAHYWTDRERFMGIDTEPQCVTKCRERFHDRPNASFEQDFVGSPDWVERWSQHRFDTVIAVNVLEHIRADLDALKGWRQIVQAGGGGHIGIFVPAFELAYSSFDRRYGHYRRYSKETLRDKLLDAGLHIEVLRYFNLPGLLAWWTTFVLLRRGDAIPGQLGIYDNVIVPLVRRFEKLVPPPFGNSIVAVCKVPPR